MLKRTEQNLFVRFGKYDADVTTWIYYVTNNKWVHSRYCTVEANYRHTQSRGLCATAELLVSNRALLKNLEINSQRDVPRKSVIRHLICCKQFTPVLILR